MLDIKKIRENKEAIESALLKRMDSVSLDQIINLDNKRIELRTKLNVLQEKRNKVSLFVRFVDLETKQVETRIVNKNQ